MIQNLNSFIDSFKTEQINKKRGKMTVFSFSYHTRLTLRVLRLLLSEPRGRKDF